MACGYMRTFSVPAEIIERLPAARLLGPFAELSDPRVRRTRRHELIDIIVIGLLTIFCGGEGWEDMVDFGHAREAWLGEFLSLPNRIPCADTFRRVFAALNPMEFQQCFLRWLDALEKSARPIDRTVAIDGKTLRGSFDTAAGQSPIHLVHAWAADSGILLGQLATQAKSNEITAIPALVKMLDIADATVTIDAMGCQKEIASTIIDGRGDYVLALKGNHENFHDDVVVLFDDVLKNGTHAAVASDYSESTNGDHGRIETRRVWTVHDVSWFAEYDQWKGLASLALVESIRESGDKITTERRYFISSLRDVSASRMSSIVRSHWSVENSLHWSLDVAFSEDASRVRRDHGPENLGMLRRVALQLLKLDKTSKRGLAAKARLAAYKPDYLIKVLLSGFGTTSG